MLSSPRISVLGKDPERKHRINANSYQQDALTTIDGFQYAAFYTSPSDESSICNVNLSRRPICFPQSQRNEKWENIVFRDYEQTVDDGHNTISIGVCRGDGTVHLAFDHHCDRLRFRISSPGLASKEPSKKWEASAFSPTQDFLPGLRLMDIMEEVTYPRFVNVADDLLLSWRIGQAGRGSDILLQYSSLTHSYTFLGQHLTGVSNSPYVNGISYQENHHFSSNSNQNSNSNSNSQGRIHISWCYRNYITPPASTGIEAHKQQAGPNGPENNYDLNYTYSDNLGGTWRSSEGVVLARLCAEDGEDGEGGSEVASSILPPKNGEGARVLKIPMGSGILNQEGQCVDSYGGFWVLNREKRGGEVKWMVYHREVTGHWTSTPVSIPARGPRPTETGNRGSICARSGTSGSNDIFLILPGNTDSSLTIMTAVKSERGLDFKTAWRGEGYDGEPLVDAGRLEVEDVLSVFTRTDLRDGKRYVVVLDSDLGTA